jgi:hypothetical protein
MEKIRGSLDQILRGASQLLELGIGTGGFAGPLQELGY